MSAAPTVPGPDTAGLPPGTTVGADPLGVPKVPAIEKHLDAAARLALTRERLRLAMAPPPPEPRVRRERTGGASTSVPFSQSAVVQTVRGWLRGLRALPAADVVEDAVTTWWAAHPLHTAGAMAADASKAYVQPYARRNPLAFVAGSAVVGALFFLTRPWRWALRPVLLAGLLPQIVSHALRRAPVGAWMNIATLFARQQAAGKRTRRAPSAPPAGAPFAPGPGARPPER